MQKGRIMAKARKYIPEVIYIALTVLSFFLGVLLPDSIHFLGASSLHYIVLLLLATEDPLLAAVITAWFLFFVLAYIIAISKLIKGTAKMLHGIMCVDLVVSVFVIMHKLATGVFSSIGIAAIGTTIRLCGVAWMLYRQKLLKQDARDGHEC